MNRLWRVLDSNVARQVSPPAFSHNLDPKRTFIGLCGSVDGCWKPIVWRSICSARVKRLTAVSNNYQGSFNGAGFSMRLLRTAHAVRTSRRPRTTGRRDQQRKRLKGEDPMKREFFATALAALFVLGVPEGLAVVDRVKL